MRPCAGHASITWPPGSHQKQPRSTMGYRVLRAPGKSSPQPYNSRRHRRKGLPRVASGRRQGARLCAQRPKGAVVCLQSPRAERVFFQGLEVGRSLGRGNLHRI